MSTVSFLSKVVALGYLRCGGYEIAFCRSPTGENIIHVQPQLLHCEIQHHNHDSPALPGDCSQLMTEYSRDSEASPVLENVGLA